MDVKKRTYSESIIPTIGLTENAAGINGTVAAGLGSLSVSVDHLDLGDGRGGQVICPDSKLSREVESFSIGTDVELEIARLQVVSDDGIGQLDARRDCVEHLLKDPRASSSKGARIPHARYSLVPIQSEDAAVRASDWVRADYQRVLRGAIQELVEDRGIEGVVGRVQVGSANRGSARRDDVGVLLRVNTTDGMTTGHHLDHLFWSETHSAEVPDQLWGGIGGLRNTNRSWTGGINPPRSYRDNGSTASSDGLVKANCNQIGHGSPAVEELLVESHCKTEGRTGVGRVDTGIEFKADRAINARLSRSRIMRCRVVESSSDQASSDRAAGFLLNGAGFNQDSKLSGIETVVEHHDVFHLIGRGRPCGNSSGGLEETESPKGQYSDVGSCPPHFGRDLLGPSTLSFDLGTNVQLSVYF